jgi:uncharacterized protein (UPF0548 family)
MPQSQKGAKFSWLGMGSKDDQRLLDEWRDAPLAYKPGQTVDSTWHSDHHEEIITSSATPEQFARARDLLLRYQFYPLSIMHHVSDFSRENRLMRPCDRIVQRIHGFRVLGFALMDGITMNEVTNVIDEPRRVGFTYITTTAHAEWGEWSAQVDWREDGALILTIDAISRLADHMPQAMAPRARRLQLQAHHQGVEAFKNAVLMNGSN